MHRLAVIAAVALVAALPAAAQQGGSAYAIGGIDVDVVAPNTDAARMAAWRLAQRKAWPLLWERLTGRPAASAPRLSDGQLDSMVAGIESQGERFSATRYIARLGVIFDRSRAADYLGAGGATLQSPPMLLLPLFTDGAAATLYQARTPWRAAWTRFRENVTPIDYVTAEGNAADNLLLTGWQLHRPDRASWRTILERFDTVDVLAAEARLVRRWPGGPIDGLFIARHGPDAAELGRFALSTAGDAGLDAMLDEAVRRIDGIYGIALRDGRLKAEPGLAEELPPAIDTAAPIALATPAGSIGDGASLEVSAVTPDAAALGAVETLLRQTPGVVGVIATSLSLGGTSRLTVTYAGGRDALAYALDRQGWRLDGSGTAATLRRRRADEAPLPPPVTEPAATTDAPQPPAATGPAQSSARAPAARRDGPADLLPPQP